MFLITEFLNTINLTGNLNFLWTPDRILVMIAICISSISLLFSIFFSRITLNITKKHNKKSVRPAIKFQRSFNDEKLYFNAGLINAGIGPAFITKIKFIYDKESYDSIFSLLNKKIKTFPLIVDAGKSTESKFDNIEVIASSEYQNIYKTNIIKGDHMFEIKRILRITELVVEYESIYNEKFHLRTFVYTGN